MNIGDRSKPPIGGMNLLKTVMTGSVSSYMTRIAGESDGGGDHTIVAHDRMIRSIRMSQYAWSTRQMISTSLAQAWLKKPLSSRKRRLSSADTSTPGGTNR